MFGYLWTWIGEIFGIYLNTEIPFGLNNTPTVRTIVLMLWIISISTIIIRTIFFRKFNNIGKSKSRD